MQRSQVLPDNLPDTGAKLPHQSTSLSIGVPTLPSTGVAWRALDTLASGIRDRICSGRAVRFAYAPSARLNACGSALDDARRPLSAEVVEQLLALATERQLEKRRAALLAGAIVNRSENRPALHPLLRDFGGRACADAPEEARLRVLHTRAQMRTLAERLHSGTLTGTNGEPITDIVNIGIGGSEFGARLLCDALQDVAPPGRRIHFVSNLDGLQIARLLKGLRAPSTLFIVSSKSFTTGETLRNARTLRTWFDAQTLASDRQWYAVTGNATAAEAFGIPADNVLDVPEWVGGRFSAWGAVGLPAALLLGWPLFEAWLRGGAAADEHWAFAALDHNLAVRLALVDVWNTTFLGCPSHCIASYDDRLAQLLPWAQQLVMESNGKSVGEDGIALDYATAPVVWGGLGNNGQHTYFQMLRETTWPRAITLIGCRTASHAFPDHAAELHAHFEAQAQALSEPSSGAAFSSVGTLIVDDLDPFHLGALMATFENATICAGWLWGINSFDQPGVELGKKLVAAKRG